jgi:hypothetical protein
MLYVQSLIPWTIMRNVRVEYVWGLPASMLELRVLCRSIVLVAARTGLLDADVSCHRELHLSGQLVVEQVSCFC